MLEIYISFKISKVCIFITFITKNLKGCSAAKSDSNWVYSRAWGSLTVGVSWSSTSFPFIGSSFKSEPNWISLPHAKSTNSTMLYYASTISYPSNCTYSSVCIFFTFKIQRGNETWQFFCCFFHSQFLMFVLYGKIDTPICRYNLGILQLFCMIWDSSLYTLESTT